MLAVEPIPEEARTRAKWIEGGSPGSVDPGGDRHLLIVDRDNRLLYELFRAFWNAGLGRTPERCRSTSR